MIANKNDKTLDNTNKGGLRKKSFANQQYLKVESDNDLSQYNHLIKPVKQTQVDYHCFNNDYTQLDIWLKKCINPNTGRFVKRYTNDYTDFTLNDPSIKNNIEMLNWWKNAHDKYFVNLKYTNLALDNACNYNNMSIIEWWFNSGLELRYTNSCIDNASANCNIAVLDMWHNKKESNNIQIKYSYNAIDNIYNTELTEAKTLKVIKWWYNHKNDYKFIYTPQIFIDYIIQKKYDKVKNYLISKKMITDNCIKMIETHENNIEDFSTCEHKKNNNHVFQEDDIVNQFINLLGPNMNGVSPNKSSDKKNEFIQFSPMLNGMNNINCTHDQSDKKDLLDDKIKKLPIEVQKHLEEKKEELNFNMLMNGKANEYIKNVVKIPFGTYKEENIFTFIGELIAKINSINNNKHNKINNESDLIKILSDKKYTTSYGKYNNIYKKFCEYRIDYINYVDELLNNIIFGHTQAKHRIKCIISKWLSGGIKSGCVIGVHGPPGIGKTTIIKNAFSQCLVNFIKYDLENDIFIAKYEEHNNYRPFNFIGLGGATNASTLNGHNITYQNSTCGDIVNCLKKSKIMNPILFFDELDKISETEHGKEIASILTHITDPSQNNHFVDRYFTEIDIDLSKCIIVFSYNNHNKIDRIYEIKLKSFDINDKINISKKFLIPEIINEIGRNEDDIKIEDKDIKSIIKNYTFESGVRKLKERIMDVISTFNLKLILNNDKNLKINNKFIDEVFENYPLVIQNTINEKNEIGCINGMFASESGMGGLTKIQLEKAYCLKDVNTPEITGNIQKIMNESIKVARTLAYKKNNVKEIDYGFHIHFPEGSTNKDGPSAGTAIACAIYSLIVDKEIKKDIAITGEIDLKGNVMQIGGLDQKLLGVKNAGVTKAYIPKNNKRDLDIIVKNDKTLLENFEVICVENIDDFIEDILV